EIDEVDSAHADRNSLRSGAQPLQLAGATRRSFFRRPLAMTGLAVGLVALVVAAVYGIRAVRSARATNHFSQIKLRQLTNDGVISYAAISPDGKFFAYSNTHKGLMMSLHLG